MSTRYRPNVDHTNLIRCRSSRNGSDIDLIVIHDTEGANIPNSVADLIGLGRYFDSTYNTPRASSCHTATDSDGNSARFVRDADKAWHCAYWNPRSLGIELIGFATQRTWTDAQINECARWIAYWCHHHHIPCYKGAVTKDGRVTHSGIVRHSDLGNLGGGHHDPGTFPLAKCMDRARAYLKEYK